MSLGGTFGVGAMEITKKSIPNAEMTLGAKKAKQGGKNQKKNRNQVETTRVEDTIEIKDNQLEDTKTDILLTDL